MNRLVLACLFAVTFAASAMAGSSSVVDIAGMLHDPLKPDGRKATVVIFTLPDCPIANTFAPEINRLFADYASRGVGFFLAHVDRELSPADAQKHATEFSFRCPVLLDSQHTLVKALGATKTPQAILLGPDGKTLYRGRINNLFADYGQRRQTVTQHDLRNALDAVLAGKPVAQPVTEAIGCHIQTTSETKSP